MLQPGQIIGGMYTIERMLGSGGMADVYIVKHVRLPKHFALKVMRLESKERTRFMERFRREAEILATLKNAHLVEVFDHNEMPDGNPYLIMELLEGEDLSQFLTRSAGPLSAATALSICNQVGEALDVAHQVGIVHRDLKPSNIFLCQKEAFPNFVKVLDFGIAKQTQAGSTPLTADCSLMGTPGYMAPEQALGRVSQIDHRTDQFALAAILYEMLTGRPAFYVPEDTTYAILNKVVNEHPPPLPQAIIDRAVQRALSKNPEDRYPSIQAFLAAVGANSLTIHVAPNAPEAVRSTVSNGEVTARFARQARTSSKRLGVAILGVSIGSIFAGGLLLGVRQWRMSQPLVAHSLPDAPSVAKPPTTPPATLPATPPATPSERDTPSSAPPKASETGGDGGVDPSAARPEPLKPVSPPPAKPPAPVPAPPPETPPPKPVAVVRTPPAPRSYLMVGADVRQERLLQRCAHQELDKLGSITNQVIKLERSGALQITEAPPSVFETNFQYCIRKVFMTADIVVPVPPAVTIRVRGGR